MPWGKYRGEELTDLPSGYLIWLVEDADDPPTDLRGEAEAILRERFGGLQVVHVERGIVPALRATAHEIIDAGVRSCARKRHPDTGGTHAAMLELQAAAAALRKCIP